MSFNWSEIKKWAEGRGLKPKKIKLGGYEWEGNNYADLDSLVTDLWNRVSNYKWVDYQKEYEKNEKDNH